MSINSPLNPPALRSSSFSFHPKDRSGASHLADPILETPPDLLCPISHDVFRDPVITSSGQVYEREAITSHLEQHKTDPLTRLPLRNDQLTPVYLLRARAAEYRESATAACVEAASSPDCAEPVKYVRRAVELSAGAVVPGLSAECCAYVQKHPSNAYDAQVLEAFAQGLRASGRRDRAATVYGALMHAGLDRAQQCELLRALLDCWAEVLGELDERALQSLERFMEGHAGFRWGQVIDLLEAAYSADAAITLCEHLLFSPAGKLAGALSAESNGVALGAGRDAREAKLREVTLKFVQLQLLAVRERQAATDRRLDAVEAGAGASPSGSSAAGTPRGPASLIRRGPLHIRRPGWLNTRTVTGAALTLATVGAAGGQPLLRLLGLFPLVLLFPSDEG